MNKTFYILFKKYPFIAISELSAQNSWNKITIDSLLLNKILKKPLVGKKTILEWALNRFTYNIFI